MLRFVRLGITAVILTACGCSEPPTSSQSSPFQPWQTEFSDQDLWEAVESDYKYPEGFYAEDVESAFPRYLSTDDIRLTGLSEWPLRYMCASQSGQAREWADRACAILGFAEEIVSESKSEKFYEFVASRRGGTGFIALRIHRCGYFDPSSAHVDKLGVRVGVFNKWPLTSAAVRELAEYLFFHESRFTRGEVALSSMSEEDEHSYTQTIYHTFTVGGDYGLPDLLSLNRSVYRVDKCTRVVSRDNWTIRTLSSWDRYGP